MVAVARVFLYGRPMLRPILASVVASIAAASAASPDWFTFPIPVLSDSKPAFDLSVLNEKPAGASGRLKVQGEHFIDGKGQPVRLFGTNLTAEANFPDEADAPRIARGLAQFGVNVVRMHFLDNQWNASDRSRSLIPASNDLAKDGLNAEALARLDRFIAALRAEGIFVNLNLHVGRKYPGYAGDMPDMHKGADNFMPDMIRELKLYAKLLVSHRNPHTGLTYRDDPAIAILEISNEDSLLLGPWWISRAPEKVREVLRARLLTWLKAKYATDKALITAWGTDEGFTGPDLLAATPLTKWIVERHEGSEHGIEPLESDGIRWTATKSGGVDWSIQLNSGKLMLEAGKRYQASFEARSATGTNLNLSASENGGAYANLGLSESCTLTGEWKSFTFSFTPGQVIPEGSRLAFSLHNKTGSVELRRMSLRPVSTGFLKPGQSLATGTVPLPQESSSLPVRRDFFAFLAQVEIDFAKEMKACLRDELGCPQMIAHSQVLFGGVMGARRESIVSDFVDTHGYWQHPGWDDGYNWTRDHWHIGNTSQIRSTDGGTLAELAMQRPAGKPYSVSEYDIPAPSDYTAELWPMFSAMACHQDWSALYHYTFAHSRADYRSEHLFNHFNAAGHPAKLGLMPFAAAVFRMGLVPRGSSTVTLSAGDGALLDLTSRLNGALWGSWRELWKSHDSSTGALALQHRTALAFPGGETPAKLDRAGSGVPPWQWDTKRGLFILEAPAARVWCGALSGQDIPAADARCLFGELPGPAPHATVTIAALDGKPLVESKRALVTALRRAENADVKWNAARDSVDDNWGHGPAGIVGLRATLTLPGTAWNVTPLNASGTPRAPARRLAGPLEITPADATIWYLLDR